MMRLMDKVIFVVVVLCCANQALCQSDATTNSTVAGNIADLTEARTFGHHLLKRLTFAIIPTAFVVGVIVTLLAALTIVSIKGLGVGVVLLVIALGQILSRTFTNAAVAPQYNAAPIPIVYQRQADAAAPVWLEKEW